MNREPIEAILDLPAAERLAIVQEIWESVVADSVAVPLTAGQRAELERRWQDLERNPDAGESWDDVKRTLRSE
ncbi:MAG TPA: addiction module protein [Thermoanaerobaculia bacterium]|nr:addiction module protein [Thermoanaerobaculia bacterium]